MDAEERAQIVAITTQQRANERELWAMLAAMKAERDQAVAALRWLAGQFRPHAEGLPMGFFSSWISPDDWQQHVLPWLDRDA